MSSDAPAYQTGHEHLADLQVRHDLLLKREIARGHGRKPADILGFAAISAEEVQRLLNLPIAEEASGSTDVQAIELALRDVEARIAARVEKSVAEGKSLPLLALASRFALRPREVDILIACLAAEVDRRYERIYGYLHDDMSRRQPSPGLALGMLCDSSAEQLSSRGLLNPLAPLRYYRLIELEDGPSAPWLSRAMRIDERIVAFLLDDRAIDARIARYLAHHDASFESRQIGSYQRDTLERLLRQVRHWMTASAPKQVLLYLSGARNAGADAIVSIAARNLGVRVLTFDADLLADTGDSIEQVLFLIFRESVLSQACIYIRNIDRLLDQPAGARVHRALLRCMSEMGNIAFLSGERSWCWGLPVDPLVLHEVELRPAGLTEQFEAWRALSRGQIEPAQLHQLVSLHPLPLGTIGEAWRRAQGLAAADDVDEPHGVPRIEHIHRACRAQASAPANLLARRIEPKHTWNDLVLPAAQREQLTALCSQARHASIVYGAWHFDRKLSLGRGLNAMFCGPPGTGKTMAAEVVAADLGLEILKIDLSQICSKYIGETEKNLRELFDQAAGANAILFFDEADALLGKRSEVKDAHDRYANTETAFLLQKIEEYAGITLLSTNFRQNVDEAFTRRMRFIVDFPLPEEEERLRIWRAVWPSEVPLAEDVDLPALARQFRLSGGSIRNVALAAAFLAAEQGQPVSMRHLMRATQGELRKMGRLVREEEQRRHA